ncbi:uncharacterized protein LOC141852907 [Brevipalpus obovatus]|uniref:uncharacterized protein LOC141852907 n=1 Tax=Brevipalpus obovatus TaxID=246614 RepID=UPI003D9F6E82
MGNSNVKHIPTGYNRPHSVLGVLGDERYSLTDFDPVSRGGGLGGGYGVGYNELHPRKKTPGKALLPPLPRSHSFHQILRPTENGVNLIQKGTIRGIDGGTKNVKEASFPADDILNPELTAILRERRCRSEANLIEEEEERIEGNIEYDENNSQDMSEDRSCSPKSSSDANGRRGMGNGVAARIQRAKNQKGPAPPPPSSFSHDHHSDVHHHHHHHQHHNHHNLHNHNSRTGSAQHHHHQHQVDKCMNNVDDDGRIKVCPKRSSEMSTSNNKGCNKNLCEKENPKSNHKSRSNSNKVNINKENDEAFLYKDNFMMIPRLKPKEFDDLNNQFRSSSGKGKIVYPEMDNDDLFQSPRANEPPLTDINALLIRELARRNREFGKFFPQHNNSQAVSEMSVTPKSGNKKEKSSSNKPHSSSNKGIKEPPMETSSHLPPVFDDNFILKRTTPTAGLFKNGKMPENYCGPFRNDGRKFADTSENFVTKPFDSDHLRSSEKFADKSFNLLSHPWMPRDQQPATIPVDTFHTINPLASSSSLGPDSINCKERKFEPLKDDSLGPISSLKHLNHSSISDSANYSDEEEDEIKVVLKPYLPPPPRRVPFEERLVIEDDLFNGDDASAIKYGRQKCWTPMEDLSSSEDDDGINCDQLSDDDEMIGKRDVRDLIQNYNTRFTLRNQLRTLIQNSRPRLSYS